MAVPTGKKSKAKKRSRRAQHDKLRLPSVAVCENCGADVQPHRACRDCGWYKDRVVLTIVDELAGEEELGAEE